jgi:sterol-4alpha-carboxylate 3-dehydrogenase (decarboxylating)
LYVGKAAEAHVLGAKVFLREDISISGDAGPNAKRRVNGRAFFLSDGISMPFFFGATKMYSFSGVLVAQNRTKVISLWSIILLAIFFLIRTLCAKKPELRRQDMKFSKECVLWTVDKSKDCWI